MTRTAAAFVETIFLTAMLAFLFLVFIFMLMQRRNIEKVSNYLWTTLKGDTAEVHASVRACLEVLGACAGHQKSDMEEVDLQGQHV